MAGTSNNTGLSSTTGQQELTKSTSNALWTDEQGQIGGERNTSSSTNNYDVTKHECNKYILASSATAQNIGTAGTTPIFLMGILVFTSTTGTITVAGFTDPSGAATNIVYPAITLTTAQPVQLLVPGNAARCETGCTITCSVAGDGPKILVDWRPI